MEKPPSEHISVIGKGHIDIYLQNTVTFIDTSHTCESTLSGHENIWCIQIRNLWRFSQKHVSPCFRSCQTTILLPPRLITLCGIITAPCALKITTPLYGQIFAELDYLGMSNISFLLRVLFLSLRGLNPALSCKPPLGARRNGYTHSLLCTSPLSLELLCFSHLWKTTLNL